VTDLSTDRRPPARSNTCTSGPGLWLSRQICSNVTLDTVDDGFAIRLVLGRPVREGVDLLPTMRGQRARPLHEGLLAASADHRQTAMSTWARSALDRSEKLLTLCASVDADVASRAGSGLTTLTPDDLRSTAQPLELLQRALPEGDHGLGILVWADALITATSRATHAEIETTLANVCRDHGVSVLCVYDRDGERDRAGTEHLDLAVARHPDELQEQRLVLRRSADTLYVDGEIDVSNLDVFGTALRTLTDTPSPTVRINLEGVTFLAAAGARALIRDTAPYRDDGADVEIDATPHITRILQLLDIHRLPRLHLSCRGVRAKS
jgi:anti-anti-sigma regulatory factor